MKRRGVDTKYPREAIKEAIYDYENSELSWEEIAKKYEIPKAVLQYHRRKETENAEEN